jgi:hypothetical protein
MKTHRLYKLLRLKNQDLRVTDNIKFTFHLCCISIKAKHICWFMTGLHVPFWQKSVYMSTFYKHRKNKNRRPWWSQSIFSAQWGFWTWVCSDFPPSLPLIFGFLHPHQSWALHLDSWKTGDQYEIKGWDQQNWGEPISLLFYDYFFIIKKGQRKYIFLLEPKIISSIWIKKI